MLYIYMDVYKCIVCIEICIGKYVYMHICICIYINSKINLKYTCIYICIYINVCIKICIYVSMYIHTYITYVKPLTVMHSIHIFIIHNKYTLIITKHLNLILWWSFFILDKRNSSTCVHAG
jgi:hypothetical protein